MGLGQDGELADRYAPLRASVDPLTPSPSKVRGLLPIQDNLRTKFYEEYHKMAEEHDKDFVKKYDDDLDTTLIFVRCRTLQMFCTC